MAQETLVVVVEDEPLSREMLRLELVKRGYSVEAVDNAEDGVKLLEETARDILLLDINLPGMTGLAALEKIRKKWSADMLPIILVTGLTDAEDVVRGLEAGANDYIQKPIHLQVLLARVETALKVKRAFEGHLVIERQRAMDARLASVSQELSRPVLDIIGTLRAILAEPHGGGDALQTKLVEMLKHSESVERILEEFQRIKESQLVSYREYIKALDLQDVEDLDVEFLESTDAQ